MIGFSHLSASQIMVLIVNYILMVLLYLGTQKNSARKYSKTRHYSSEKAGRERIAVCSTYSFKMFLMCFLK